MSYQLDFLIPINNPCDANSRNLIRDTLQIRKTECGRPVRIHLFLILTFELFRGSLFNANIIL